VLRPRPLCSVSHRNVDTLCGDFDVPQFTIFCAERPIFQRWVGGRGGGGGGGGGICGRRGMLRGSLLISLPSYEREPAFSWPRYTGSSHMLLPGHRCSPTQACHALNHFFITMFRGGVKRHRRVRASVWSPKSLRQIRSECRKLSDPTLKMFPPYPKLDEIQAVTEHQRFSSSDRCPRLHSWAMNFSPNDRGHRCRGAHDENSTENKYSKSARKASAVDAIGQGQHPGDRG